MNDNLIKISNYLFTINILLDDHTMFPQINFMTLLDYVNTSECAIVRQRGWETTSKWSLMRSNSSISMLLATQPCSPLYSSFQIYFLYGKDRRKLLSRVSHWFWCLWQGLQGQKHRHRITRCHQSHQGPEDQRITQVRRMHSQRDQHSLSHRAM